MLLLLCLALSGTVHSEIAVGQQPSVAPAKTILGKKELQTLWQNLAGADARKAYQSIGQLAGAPASALPFLDQRLKNFPAPDVKKIFRLIHDLDSDHFIVRARASAELQKIGLAARACLEDAFVAPPSPEVYHRLKNLLAKLAFGPRAAVDVQTWRALETLENIGTPAAMKILQRLAKGEPLLWQTEQARLSLARLQKPRPVIHLAKDIQETALLKGHTNRVYDLNYSPDGKLLASAGADGTARLWDADAGKLLTTFHHSGGVWSVAFAGAGKLLATGAADFLIRIWDIPTQAQLYTLAGHQGLVYALAASPDGKLLASGASDKMVRLWEAATGNSLATLEGHDATVWTVAFSPDGRTLISASTDETVRLWEVVTGKERAVFTGHNTFVRAAGYLANGKRIVSCDTNNILKGWDLRTGQPLFSENTGHTGGVRQLACGPDGNLFATAGAEGNVKLWDATGKELANLEAHNDVARSVAFRPDGHYLATGGYDHRIKIWKLAGQ